MFRLHGEHVRAARALLRWGQKKLADEASKIAPVSVETIKAWEATNGAIRATVDRMEAVAHTLEAAGVELLNHGSPGARLRPPSSDEG
ncbi:MAG TPA: hypothetical protein VGE72_23355 [Azospirillum sp.]